MIYCRNPCTDENLANHNFYFAHHDPRNFVQCSAHKQCWVMPCPEGTVWSQQYLTCTSGLTDGGLELPGDIELPEGEGPCFDGCQHETTCEKDSLVLDCGIGRIDILSAFFGRTKPDPDVCPYEK